MSTKPATCLYDGTTIHEDSEESAALEYLAALGKPAAEVTVDGKSTRYYRSGDIFRAMLSLEGGCHEPPALLLGAHHAPELFLARITPDDMKLFKKGGREMWYLLSNDGGDLGNVCQEGIFALESLLRQGCSVVTTLATASSSMPSSAVEMRCTPTVPRPAGACLTVPMCWLRRSATAWLKEVTEYV